MKNFEHFTIDNYLSIIEGEAFILGNQFVTITSVVFKRGWRYKVKVVLADGRHAVAYGVQPTEEDSAYYAVCEAYEAACKKLGVKAIA